MMTLGIRCWCLSILLIYLMYSGYTLLWWPRVCMRYINIPHVPWIHIVMMTLGIPRVQIVMMTLGTHCCCSSISLYLKYSGYTLLWWPLVCVAGAYLYYYYNLCTLDTHWFDDPGYTLLVLIYITIIPYVLWIHIVMMTLGIYCWCLSISLL